MSTTVSIQELNKADVLAALYNASRPLGMGFMQYDPKPMTREEATAILDAGHTYFDYLKGRVMKIDLSGDLDVRTGLYDRDNGEGAGERAIAALRTENTPDAAALAEAHAAGVKEAAADAKRMMGVESRLVPGGVALGLSDVKSVLGPKVAAAVKEPT